MVADLQHVDVDQEPALRQHRLNRHLRVAGEQRAESAAAQQPHDRCVVDVSLGQRSGHVLGGRIEERKCRRRIKAQGHARAGDGELPARLPSGLEHEARIGRILVRAAPVEDEAHLVAVQGRDEAGDVVLVRVGQDHDVDPPTPPRQPLPEPSEEEVGIRATVDQHAGP